jgi:sugar-specific transcriptional regulator TrmB
MVVNNIKSKLMDIGFSEYEAKAYIALIIENPSTAYEIAKRAPVPTSKIYEVLAKLSERGAVFEIDDKEKRRYMPLSPDELIATHRSKMEGTLDELRDGLNSVNSNADLSFLRTIRDYGYLIDKAKRIIDEAAETLLVSIWPREMELLRPALESADNRGVKIAIVHFGQSQTLVGQTFCHPIEDMILAEKGGQGLVVVADLKEVLFARVTSSGAAEGMHSISKGFVAMAEDFIRHDIYVMKIVERFDNLLLKKFGKNYHKLRDVFKDEEL